MNIISKLDNEPNDVGGLTAGELKEKFDEAGLVIQKYINEVLLPGAENPDNIMVGGDTLTNVLNAIKSAAAALLEDYNRHETNRENPHAVTQEQVGLGRVDNTPDTEKPVSAKQQEALDLKADKESVILKGAGTEYTPTTATDPANKGYVDATAAEVVLGRIPDNSLTTEKYKNKSITKEKLADDAIYAYTRTEALSPETKKEFGLVNTAVPDDVFSILKKAVIYDNQFTDVLGDPANICRFGTGRYIGTGTYGKDNPNSLTFDFEPKLVIITGVDKTEGGTEYFYSGTMFYLWGAATANVIYNRASFSLGDISSQPAFANNIVSVEGKTMKWWGKAYRQQQCNDTTAVYGWIAIG